MNPPFSRWQPAALCLLALSCFVAGAAQTFQVVSTIPPLSKAPSGGGGDSWTPILSPDGRYVLFASRANNLVWTPSSNPIPVLAPPKLNVYLRDRTNGTTTLVSVNLAATGGGSGDSTPTGLSTNGLYALFESGASDLVPGDTNNATDVFVRDLAHGVTVLVSAGTNGGAANGSSWSSVLTPNGSNVVFVSAASNLVPDDTNGIPDVFVRDWQAGLTTLVSVGATGATNSSLPFCSSEAPDITPDGRYVVFYSTAANLVPGAAGAAGEIYVRDLLGRTTTWASSYADTALASALGITPAISYSQAMSADGQFIAYEASADPSLNLGSSGAYCGVILRYNLGTGFTDVINTNAYVPRFGAYQDMRNLDMTPDGRFIAFVANTNGASGTNTCGYVWDAQGGATTLVSGDLTNQVTPNSTCDWPTLDASGRFVAFLSMSTNLVTNSLAGDYHLYLRNLQAGTTRLVDADTNGAGAILSLGLETVPCLSADGRFVAFECFDANLVPYDQNRSFDVFVRDMTRATNELVSARDPLLPSLTPSGPSGLSTLSVSTNGRYVAFCSEADNLAANDTNGSRDIFVRDLVAGSDVLVSVATNSITSGDNVSQDPVISADGRYVAFTSSADNLVAGDTNKAQDVFLRDMQAGTTMLVSLNRYGSGPGNGPSYSPRISADGGAVLFRSKATDLASGSFSGENLFFRKLQWGTNYALSTSGFSDASMTPDGSRLAFGPTSAGLFVWDSKSATSTFLSGTGGAVSTVAISPGGQSIVYSTSGGGLGAVDVASRANRGISTLRVSSRPGLRFSGDSRFLAYSAITNSTSQVYLYDFQAKTNALLSQSSLSPGAPANGPSDSPDISPDGRFVAYRSAATDLVFGVTNGFRNVFLYDRQSGVTMLLSVNRFGTAAADNRSSNPVFSGDGQTLFFQSWSSDIVAADFNQSGDAFAYSLYASAPIPLLYATMVPGTDPADGPWISWPAVEGKTYQVQFKNSLNDPAWQSAVGAVSVLGTRGYLKDLAPAASQRFYRIAAF